MTVLSIEGFEAFGLSGNAVNLEDKHPGSSTTGLVVQAGRLTGKSLEFSSTTDQLFMSVPNTAEIVFGFAFKMAALGFERIIFLRQGGSNNLGLVINTDGSIDVERTATVLSSTAAGVITAGTWHYIEFKGNIHNSTGSYDLKVDEVSVTSGSGVDTQNSTNAYTDEILVRGRNATTWLIDDVYILDTSVTEITGDDDFLGTQVVKAIYPDGDSAVAWTPDSGGTNSTQVDENPHDDDTSYVESSTSTQKDLYTYGNPTGISGIKCIQVNTICKETDATNYTLIQPVKSGATETDDAAQAIAGTTYENLNRVLSKDPNTAAAWTPSAVDAIISGIKVG